MRLPLSFPKEIFFAMRSHYFHKIILACEQLMQNIAILHSFGYIRDTCAELQFRSPFHISCPKELAI